MNNDISFLRDLARNADKHSRMSRKAARKALAANRLDLAALHARDADFWTRRRVERLATLSHLIAEQAL